MRHTSRKAPLRAMALPHGVAGLALWPPCANIGRGRPTPQRLERERLAREARAAKAKRAWRGAAAETAGGHTKFSRPAARPPPCAWLPAGGG